MGTINVLGASGDTKVIWDASKAIEVEAAKETFRKLKAKGYIAYEVKNDGTQGSVISEFNPAAERIILAPQMSGG